jgi:hypothetical protein
MVLVKENLESSDLSMGLLGYQTILVQLGREEIVVCNAYYPPKTWKKDKGETYRYTDPRNVLRALYNSVENYILTGDINDEGIIGDMGDYHGVPTFRDG